MDGGIKAERQKDQGGKAGGWEKREIIVPQRAG